MGTLNIIEGDVKIKDNDGNVVQITDNRLNVDPISKEMIVKLFDIEAAINLQTEVLRKLLFVIATSYGKSEEVEEEF